MSNSNYSLNSFPQPTTKRRVDSGGADFYPTPQWATQALVDHESFDGDVGEVACGDGEMARVLEKNGLTVFATDLYDRGFGTSDVDFLQSNRVFDNIITNPPYSLADAFTIHALSQSRRKVAFLLRLAFLEGGDRQEDIFQKFPPTRVWIFSERVTFYPKGQERSSGGTTAYAWFVWDHADEGWENQGTELKWISLGRKPNGRRTKKSVIGSTLSLSDLR